jgi:hypothetical protein
MDQNIDEATMIAQILFNSQPSIYNTTIEILAREQITGAAVPTLL